MNAEDIHHHLQDVGALKATWKKGPWTKEPDRVEWDSLGFHCLILRSEVTGALNGYVGVPPSHPLSGKDYGEEDLAAHGGLTFAGPSIDHICRMTPEGLVDDLWWFGFDCAHSSDLRPAFIGHPLLGAYSPFFIGVYREIRYVREQVEQLAAQLATAANRRKRGANVAKKILIEEN